MKTVKLISLLLPLIPVLGGRLDAQDAATLSVSAHMDIYRAGGYNDGSDGSAPAVFTFRAGPGQVLKFSSVSGSWVCGTGNPEYGPDGTSTGNCYHAGGQSYQNPIGPFAGYATTDFVEALTGMFLEDSLPVSPPPPTRFYIQDNSQGGVPTDSLILSPRIGQVFFIGDGRTGTGTGGLQVFRVPPTATHLYLGYTDNCGYWINTTPGCYSDNAGSLTAVFSIVKHVPDWIAPTLSSAPSARIASAMAYDAAIHSTVLFGGNSAFNPGQTYGDTWIWHNRWTQLFPAASPPARGDAGIAYDPAMGKAVLFGGIANTSNPLPFGDTWTWDGVTWDQLSPPVSPPARSPSTFGMVYDPATENVVLFGGIGMPTGDYGGIPFGDTWIWNGRTKTWTQQFPSSNPSPRQTTLAYDAIHHNVVLFGGDNGGGDCCRIYYNDTWTWDGVNWTQQFPATSPSPRTRQTMAYDDTLGRVIVFGGTSGPPNALNDTWAWDGKTWKQLTLPNEPSARYVSSMDFDPLNGGLVLFGGELSGDILTNETWLFVPVPVP